VCVVTRIRAGKQELWFDSGQGHEIFLLYKVSISAFGSTQASVYV
jgi:hypothetical protein